MRGLAAYAVLLASAALASDVDVRATASGRVSLKVASAPLSEVLDRLSRQTGMKVIYDGQPPRTLVRGRQVEDATPADAVANVLEGLGVSYALRLDATGAKVDTLLVLGGPGGGGGTAGASGTDGTAGTASGAMSPAARAAAAAARRVPRVPHLPSPAMEDNGGDDEDIPQEGNGEEAVILRPGDEGETGRPPLGIPGAMPNVPGLTGPISPLVMPTPVPASPPPIPPQ